MPLAVNAPPVNTFGYNFALGGVQSSVSLRIYAWLPAVYQVLGPGLRAVVWVQGCSLRCPGCMVPETWSTSSGQWVNPSELARAILARQDIEGITVSGGEPTEQAAAVAHLLAEIKAAGKNTWVYTGYTLEELLRRHDPDTDYLLSLIDVLVDGRYDLSQAGSYALRGSANQRIIHLTDAIPPERVSREAAGQFEIRLDNQGRLTLIGMPPPGFLSALRQALLLRGLQIASDSPWK